VSMSEPTTSVPETPLPTAAVADACVRLGVPLRLAPVQLVPLLPGRPFSGPARAITHLGSVDVLLASIEGAASGSVLVVDNGGRDDEACVGDLMVDRFVYGTVSRVSPEAPIPVLARSRELKMLGGAGN